MVRIRELMLCLLLAACAAQGPQPGESAVRYGKIAGIEAISLEGGNHLGLGMIIGAVAGGVIGHNIGGGTGQDVATVAGVIGGGLVGNKVQNKYVDRQPGQYITVTLDNGVAVGITQPADMALHVGDLVRVDGSGQDARVVRR
jgi:outer membrane lipoprotein SlyB